ncbi:hypothetical protein QZH41_000619 [Actinostola sp. cb2023]|nr:hypothetical protein QZH41_000619 [Actinostola sp. cb2023]
MRDSPSKLEIPQQWNDKLAKRDWLHNVVRRFLSYYVFQNQEISILADQVSALENTLQLGFSCRAPGCDRQYKSDAWRVSLGYLWFLFGLLALIPSGTAFVACVTFVFIDNSSALSIKCYVCIDSNANCKTNEKDCGSSAILNRWEQGEVISRWILRVELYAASQQWDDKKTAGKAALNFPSDKLDVLLALPSEERTSWKKIKEILLREYQPSKANSEELFLARIKKDGESHLVYSKQLERLYRKAFALASQVKLNEQSAEAIKRQFLRGIKQDIAQKLKLHHPDDSIDKLVTRAKEIEEVLCRPNVDIHAIDNNQPLQQLQSDVKELKEIVSSLSKASISVSAPNQVSVEGVNQQGHRQYQTSQNRGERLGRGERRTECYRCGKPGHFARDCSSGTPRQNQTASTSRRDIQCHNCGGWGHLARQCPSTPLN